MMSESFGSNCIYQYYHNDCIGKGAFGTVYRASITARGNYIGPDTVAVKVIPFYGSSAAEDGDHTDSLRKWNTLLQLSHPNLVAYHKVSIQLSPLKTISIEIMMDYFPDGDLERLIRLHKLLNAPKKLSLATAVDYAYQIANGLTYLHYKNIIHYDLKPANILLQQHGRGDLRLHIGDLEDSIPRSDSDYSGLRGTVPYVSPEMVKKAFAGTRELVGRKTDIWSLGCIILDLMRIVFNVPGKWLRLESTREIVSITDMPDQIVLLKIAEGFVPVIPEIIGDRYARLIRECLCVSVFERISAKDLLNALEKARSDCGFRSKETAGVSANNAPLERLELITDEKMESLQWDEQLSPQHMETIVTHLNNCQTTADTEQLNKLMCSGYVAMPGIKDDRDLHNDHIENVRLCIRAVLDSAAESPPYHGGIFLQNLFYRKSSASNTTNAKISFILGEKRNLPDLWNGWIAERSANVAYIPPECVAALPALAGDMTKVDSWAVGCLLIELLGHGKPLKLVRKLRYVPSVERFLHAKCSLDYLKKFYQEAGQEGLIIGPEIVWPDVRLPLACEEFLAQSVSCDPSRRLTLLELSKLPFVNPEISVEQLLTMDMEYYRTVNFPFPLHLHDIRDHPFLAKEPSMDIVTAEAEWIAGSPRIGDGSPGPSRVDVWKFHLRDESERITYTKAFGQLHNVLETDTYSDPSVRNRSAYYDVRALQKGHQNIVQYFGCQFVPRSSPWSDPQFLIITEHCPGGNFQEAASCYIPANVLTKWIKSVLRGLDYLHKHGIIHRNLCSAMVFFTEPTYRGTVKIAGFHNMRQLTNDRTLNREISARHGSDGRFVAPEIAEIYQNNTNIGRKSDIWSVACILLHLATGRPPLYLSPTGRAVDSEMAVLYFLARKTLPIIPDWVPAAVLKFIKRCLKFNAADRPTAAELLQSNAAAFDCQPGDTDYYVEQRPGDSLPSETLSYWESAP